MQRYFGGDIGFEVIILAIIALAADAAPAGGGKAHLVVLIGFLPRGGGGGRGVVLVHIIELDVDARINLATLRRNGAAFPIAIGTQR